jgi:hypothetical protein
MATNTKERTLKNKNRSRPKKKTADKIRRIKTQRKRLVGLGVSETVVAKLPPVAVRTLLRRPAKIKASLASGA